MARPSPSDLLVPSAVGALVAVELVLARPEGWALGIALQLAALVPLVWRRLHPLTAALSSTVLLVATPVLGPRLEDMAAQLLVLALICFTLARWPAVRRGAVGVAVLLTGLLLVYVFADARDNDVTDVFFVAAVVLPPYVFGRVVRRLAEQRELLIRQQDLIAAQAVRAERERIARDLHDVIAHSVSAMVVQAAAAQDLVGTDPVRASALLESVTATGRGALTETGHLLHLLRDDESEPGLRPTPGLADVPRLVSELQAAGLELDAQVEAPTHPLRGSADVSAFRVVQEVLTNARRYADGPVRLRVGAVDGHLRITSSNRALSPAGPRGSGLGLQGIAERVALLGGTLEHREDDERFEIEASIPLSGSAT